MLFIGSVRVIQYVLNFFFTELMHVQVMIISLQRQQFFMRASLSDTAVPNHQNHICMTDRGKAVSYYKRGSPFQNFAYGILNQLLRLGVDRTGGLIQNKDTRIR